MVDLAFEHRLLIIERGFEFLVLKNYFNQLLLCEFISLIWVSLFDFDSFELAFGIYYCGFASPQFAAKVPKPDLSVFYFQLTDPCIFHSLFEALQITNQYFVVVLVVS